MCYNFLMHFLVELIQSYGYFIVFFGTVLEGETIVALAGFAAYQGHLSLQIIIPIAIVGAVIGDHSFFYFGRHKGRKILAKHPEWHGRVEKIHGWLDRHQNLLIFSSRFLYGFRMVTPIVLGTSRVSGFRFFILNALGALVWAILFAFGGYFFGEAIESMLGNIKRFEGMIVAGVILIAFIIQIIAWCRRRNERHSIDNIHDSGQ